MTNYVTFSLTNLLFSATVLNFDICLKVIKLSLKHNLSKYFFVCILHVIDMLMKIKNKMSI